MSGSQPATLGNTSANSGGRISGCMANMPIATRLIIGFCFIVFVYTPLMYPTDQYYAMCPYFVTENNEWGRVITSTFIHGGTARGIPHIGMNMLATYFIMGMRVEPVYGSLCTLGQVALFTLLNGVMYVFIYKCGIWIAGKPPYWVKCSVGFSGVIFSLLLSELATLPPGASRSFCGFCNVPAWIYPWILLFVLALIPNVSFVGHLSGALVGLMYRYGLLNFLTLKRTWLLQIEQWSWLQPLVTSSLYHRCPSEPIVPDPYGDRCPQLPERPCECLTTCCGDCWTENRENLRERMQTRTRRDGVAVYQQVSAVETGDTLESTELDIVVAGESEAWPPAAAAAAASDSQRVPRRSKRDVAPPDSHRRPHHASRLLAATAPKSSPQSQQSDGGGSSSSPPSSSNK